MMDKYEKLYNEALERARKAYNAIPPESRGARKIIEDAFPELRESEDERIRKALIGHFRTLSYDLSVNGFSKEDFIFYLEKQKELFKSGRGLYYYDGGKTVYMGYPATEENPYDFAMSHQEKQKEQNNEEGDFTIYHPQKNGEGKYECIPFSFYGSLTSFSNNKDLMDFLNESFYDKEECKRWCEMENEPKLPKCSKHKVKKDSVLDYLCESSSDKKQKEQKHAPDDLQKSFEAGQTSIVDNPEQYGLYKKAEWSEEDERRIDAICELLENTSAIHPNYSRRKLIVWLKSLHPVKQEWSEEDEGKIESIKGLITMGKFADTNTIRTIWKLLDSIRPSWKPSEDEERLINTSISFLKDFADKGYENAVECIDWLKSKLNGDSCK